MCWKVVSWNSKQSKDATQPFNLRCKGFALSRAQCQAPSEEAEKKLHSLVCCCSVFFRADARRRRQRNWSFEPTALPLRVEEILRPMQRPQKGSAFKRNMAGASLRVRTYCSWRRAALRSKVFLTSGHPERQSPRPHSRIKAAAPSTDSTRTFSAWGTRTGFGWPTNHLWLAPWTSAAQDICAKPSACHPKQPTARLPSPEDVSHNAWSSSELMLGLHKPNTRWLCFAAITQQLCRRRWEGSNAALKTPVGSSHPYKGKPAFKPSIKNLSGPRPPWRKTGPSFLAKEILEVLGVDQATHIPFLMTDIGASQCSLAIKSGGRRPPAQGWHRPRLF